MSAALSAPESAPAAPAHSAAPLPARLGLWTLLGLIGLVGAVALYPGVWQVESGWLAAWNVTEPAALANVALAPDLWRGMGIGALLPAQPLLLLGLAPAVAVKWVLVSTLALGALGVYAWLAPQFGDRGGALGAAVWLLAPLHLSTVFVSGELAALLVLALLPLALAGLRALEVQGSLLGAGVAVIALVWMGRAQAGLALAALLLAAAYAGLVLRHRLALLTTLVAGAVALFSLAGLWGVRAEPAVPFADQFLSLYGLLRAAPADPAAGEPVQIGVGVLALAIMGLFALATGERLADREQRRLLIFAALTTLILIFLALPLAAWLWRATRADLLFAAPWKPLLLAGPLLAAMAAALPALMPSFARTPVWVATVGALLIAAQPALTPAYTQNFPPARPLAIVGANDLALTQANVTLAPAGDAATLTLEWNVLHTPTFDDSLFFQALEEGDPPRVIAQLDVQPLPERPATTWQPGEVLTDTWSLPLPADLANPAALVYYAGFYNWSDGTRRPISLGTAATPVGAEDKLILHAEAPNAR